MGAGHYSLYRGLLYQGLSVYHLSLVLTYLVSSQFE